MVPQESVWYGKSLQRRFLRLRQRIISPHGCPYQDVKRSGWMRDMGSVKIQFQVQALGEPHLCQAFLHGVHPYLTQEVKVRCQLYQTWIQMTGLVWMREHSVGICWSHGCSLTSRIMKRLGSLSKTGFRPVSVKWCISFFQFSFACT